MKRFSGETLPERCAEIGRQIFAQCVQHRDVGVWVRVGVRRVVMGCGDAGVVVVAAVVLAMLVMCV